MKIEIIGIENQEIQRVIDHLKKDGLIGLPTETVYGLGARADHFEAVKKIYTLKGRPTNHPLIVHLSPAINNTENSWLETLSPWAREIPEEAIRLAQVFWPGPLTMIFKKSKEVGEFVTGGNETVALRCPNHPIALTILSGVKTGIAAPSANRYGKLSPTSAQHVYEEFFPIKNDFPSDYDLLIPDAGSCEVGIESTIIDMSRIDSQGIIILRPGMISAGDIISKTGLNLNKSRDTKVAHSGSHMAHYAPMTPMYLMNQPLMNTDINHYEKAIWLSIEKEDFNHSANVKTLQLPHHPKDFARVIYGVLRSIDKESLDKIYLRDLPHTLEWEAIRDRLMRAVTGSGKSL